jgi:uncharacterized protein (TIGR00730 family)
MQNEITKKEIIKEINNHVSEISKEFKSGFELLKKYPKSVTIFGSSRITSNDDYYKKAQNLSERIVNEINYSIITGGGPGIMEASNRGAKNTNGDSIGINITLPHEQHINKYVTESISLNYFFVRKPLLNFSAEAYIFFPGGFGTFDELFSILTLLQTQKIPQIPVILFGVDFWNPFVSLIKSQMLDKYKTIDVDNMNLFIITDSEDDVIEIIKSAPISNWWKNID